MGNIYKIYWVKFDGGIITLLIENLETHERREMQLTGDELWMMGKWIERNV